jgi:hypothetical protein
MRDLCHVCKRIFKRTDGWRVNDAGYKVHPEGQCRGPYAVRTYMVGYRGDAPSFLGRLPETDQDIAILTDELVGKGMEVKVLRMNHRSVNRILKEMGL